VFYPTSPLKMTQQWQRAISANKPASYGGSDAETRLEIRGCCISDVSGTGPTLYCSVAGGPRLALARTSQAKPFCKVGFRFDSDDGEVKFTCEGAGELLIVGVLASLSDGVVTEPASKKARLEESTRSSPAISASAAGSPKTATKAVAAEKPSSPAAKPSKENAPEKPSSPAVTPSKVVPMVAYAASSPKPQQATAKPAAKEQQSASSVTHRVLPSGLRYEVLKVGNGLQAKPGKKVKVRYEGRLGRTGQRFDKGVIEFRLGMGEVIKGWDEGVKGMLKGERRRLLVPSRLGYGAAGAPPVIPPNSDLVFEVEMLQN